MNWAFFILLDEDFFATLSLASLEYCFFEVVKCVIEVERNFAQVGQTYLWEFQWLQKAFLHLMLMIEQFWYREELSKNSERQTSLISSWNTEQQSLFAFSIKYSHFFDGCWFVCAFLFGISSFILRFEIHTFALPKGFLKLIIFLVLWFQYQVSSRKST